MKKKAIFPGSFDPFTIGHKDILDQALNVFDEIIIAVGENSSKSVSYTHLTLPTILLV